MQAKKFITNALDKTFWKFILVGIINTVFGTFIMFSFYNALKFSYWVSSASNYLFGSILSYFLNRHFTFNSKERSSTTLPRFVVNILVCYLLAYGIAKPLASYFLAAASTALRENVAMLLGMLLFILLNYLGQRLWVFGKNKK